MTKEDVETIQRLKSQRNFSYDKGNGKGQPTIDLDKIHATRSHPNHHKGLTHPSRRGLRLLNNYGSSRVYPVANSSP